MKAALANEKIILVKKQDDCVFDNKEQQEIIDDWNTNLGKEVAKRIVRKFWYEHEGIEEPKEGKWGKIKGMKNRQEFNTLKHISEYMMILMISEPNGPDGAEWKNYTNTPRPQEKSRSDDGQWKKIEACMNSVFGKPYLTEEDWMI